MLLNEPLHLGEEIRPIQKDAVEQGKSQGPRQVSTQRLILVFESE